MPDLPAPATGSTSIPGLADALELAAIAREAWPQMHAALRASGVPLNDEDDDKKKDEPAGSGAGAGAGGGETGDPELEAIIAKAENPDAVRNAIRRQTEAAKAEKKRADDLAKKVKEHEDAKLSDKEKLEGRAKTAEEEAAAAKRVAMQFEVAADKDLKLGLAKRLTGATREEMEADADALIADMGDAAKVGGSPKPKPSGGKPKGQGGDGGATPPAGAIGDDHPAGMARIRAGYAQSGRSE